MLQTVESHPVSLKTNQTQTYPQTALEARQMLLDIIIDIIMFVKVRDNEWVR